MIKTLFRAFLLGIGIGVLLAPRAGSETRRLLSEKLNNVLDGVNDLTDKLDRSSDGNDATSVVPQQHYVEGSNTSREVNRADPMPM